MKALYELGWTLWDALCCGDPVGHLRSWWRVVSGRVDAEERIVPTGGRVAVAGEAPASRGRGWMIGEEAGVR